MSFSAVEQALPARGQDAERELERLYARHADDVRAHVRLVLRGGSDVEDVVQQTFLKALRALRSGTRPRQARAWLVAIAHNECRLLFRAASRRPVELGLDESTVRAPEPAGPRADDIRAALESLAPKQRAALVLRELEGRSYGEIASALDVSVAAVETLLFRARRAMREQLETAAGCEEVVALLAADDLVEQDRRRLRAHLRACEDCARLERSRRGRLGALKRLGSLVPTPGWLVSPLGGGGGKAVVTIAAAAVAAGGTAQVVATRPAPPKPAPPLAHREPIAHPAAHGDAAVRPSVSVAAVPAALAPKTAARKHAKPHRAKPKPKRVAPVRPAPGHPAAASAPPGHAATPAPAHPKPHPKPKPKPKPHARTRPKHESSAASPKQRGRRDLPQRPRPKRVRPLPAVPVPPVDVPRVDLPETPVVTAPDPAKKISEAERKVPVPAASQLVDVPSSPSRSRARPPAPGHLSRSPVPAPQGGGAPLAAVDGVASP